jgi:hypothetical protein
VHLDSGPAMSKKSGKDPSMKMNLCCVFCSVKRHGSSGYHHTSLFELATSRLTQLAESSA